MLGIYFALEFSKPPENLVHIINRLLLVLGIFSVTLVLANISAKLIKEGIVIPYPIMPRQLNNSCIQSLNQILKIK
jgi:hypothetical protein